MKVEEIEVGKKDNTDSRIDKIYAKRVPIYAVYQTPERAALQYADATELAAAQRRRMAVLNGIRAQIDGLVEGWRRSKNSQAKAGRYDARVAAALILCLEEDDGNAQASFAEIRAEVLDERNSWGRFQYLISASTVAVVTAIVLGILWLSFFGLPPVPALPLGSSLLLAGIGGVLGAFFSIAVGVMGRSVQTSLNRRDNIADAVLRVIVGLIAAWVLILLLRAKLLSGFQIGDQPLSGDMISVEVTLLIGFVAGFLERLVPDILAKAGQSKEESKPAVVPVETPKEKPKPEAAIAVPDAQGLDIEETPKPNGSASENGETPPAIPLAADALPKPV